MAFKKFFSPKRGIAGKYDTPHLTISKHHVIFNEKAREQVGGAFNYVVLYFDDETNSVGLRFWKERVLDSYTVSREAKRYKDCLIINGRRFFEKFGIREIVDKVGKNTFPVVRDEKQKNFYIAALKK